MTIYICPSCNTALLTLRKPCYHCGMMFTLDLECPNCGKMEREHLRTCPRRERGEKPKIVCPLCGGPRHRHEVTATKHECLWRQCFTGRAQYDVENDGPPEEDEITLREFAGWLEFMKEENGGVPPAGTIDSEREIRRLRKQSDGSGKS